jgi:phage tail sheath protein FI
MSFQVSPGVQVKEIDLTNVVPAVSTSIGAIAGAFQWGPVEEIVTVGSEKDLVNVFGEPNADTFKYFMPAAQFLQYGNALRVVRAETDNANATSDGTTGVKVKNADDFEAQFATLAANATLVAIARYPGELGNSIGVEVCGADATAFSGWTYKSLFDSAPGTSDYAASKGGSNDELHVVVYDTTGAISGEEGTVLETYAFVSQASDARANDGTNNYYLDVVNGQSNYVYAIQLPAATFTEQGSTAQGTTFSAPSSAVSETLADGVDDNAPTVGELELAYDMFADAETIDVNLIIGGQAHTGADAVTHANTIIALAEGRKDCVAFVSPSIADTVNNSTAATDVIAWANSLTSSSYAVIDSTALYVYDKYNDVYRWIAASGAVAGLCANTDNVADAWFSPAGLNRGQILGVTKIAFNPKKADRDELYKARVNPIVSFPGEGTVLFGDKTAQAKPSAFDRINVRRLFIVLEKAVATAAKYQLFEFNDEFTRAQFRNMVEPFLRDIKGRRGITDFYVVADETNNTGQIIDSNQFVADIYIKPARSINFITLNFIATRTGVEFSEIVGQ